MKAYAKEFRPRHPTGFEIRHVGSDVNTGLPDGSRSRNRHGDTLNVNLFHSSYPTLCHGAISVPFLDTEAIASRGIALDLSSGLVGFGAPRRTPTFRFVPSGFV